MMVSYERQDKQTVNTADGCVIRMYLTMMQSQVAHTEEHSFIHTIALAQTTSGTYSDTLQDWQHLTKVQHMQQLYQ